MEDTGKKAEQVYRWLLAYIEENKFLGQLKLPSENALCRKLNVSRSTVRSALEGMEQEELIYRIKGSGTYVNKEVVLSRELDVGTTPLKIGLILQGQDAYANSSLLEGVKSALPAHQINLRVFLTDNKFSNERRCLQTVMHQNFQGFIIDGVKASLLNPNLDCYKELYRRHIPVIFYNNYYKNLPCPRVIINDTECADQLVGLLIQAGHRHIAGIFNYDNYQSIEKFQGTVAAMQKRGVEFQDDYIKWCISNEAHDQSFVRVIERFLKGLPRCTAIVCCNVMIYRLVRQALERMGRQVPEDYSLVCFDYSGDDWEQEGITCSIHQGYEMGHTVATRLVTMIRQKECDDKNYTRVMRAKIHIGTSIRELS